MTEVEVNRSRQKFHHLLAIICFGLFAGAMALNAVPSPGGEISPPRGIIWNAFQYGGPLLIGGICLVGTRWAFMTAVIYGTIGLALDLATIVQSLTDESESTTFLMVILTTSFLNFLLIVLGGKCLLSTVALNATSSKTQ